MIWQQNEKELLLICKRLSIMLKSGITLINGIRILSADNSTKSDSRLSGVLKHIYNSLQGGSSFSKAVSDNREIFPDYMVAVVMAGEAGGILPEVLERQANSINRDYQAHEKLKTAMIYPVFLLITSVVVILIMLLIVLPIFSDLFRGMNVSLPMPTRILLNIGAFVHSYVIQCVIALLFIGIVAWHAIQDKSRQLKIYELVLSIPVWGRIMYYLDMQRWLDILSLLLQGGILLTDSIEIANKVLINKYMYHRLLPMSRKIQQGERFSDALKRSKCTDAIVMDLVIAGEVSGALPEMLSEAARICQIEADNLLQRLQVLIEPTIILFIGVITGLLVISIMLPIMDLMTLYS